MQHVNVSKGFNLFSTRTIVLVGIYCGPRLTLHTHKKGNEMSKKKHTLATARGERTDNTEAVREVNRDVLEIIMCLN